MAETAPAGARFRAVAFVHHFGAALNGHTHFHCLITDGRFAATPTGEAVFYEAGPVDIDRVQAQVRRRVLAWLVRHGYLEPEAAATMLGWRHSGGFSNTWGSPRGLHRSICDSASGDAA